MKKKLVTLSLLSALMLSSCSKELDNTKVTNNENMISFSTYSNLSKGIVSTNDNFPVENSRFRVAAFLDGLGKYMECDIVADANKKWDYANPSDKAYWPASALDFVAFTPIVEGSTIAFNMPTSTMTYEVPTAIANQVDLMYAYQNNVTKPVPIAPVTMNFKHALTQIRFQATTTSSNLFVDIAANGIDICNILSNGTLNVSADTATWALDKVKKSSYRIENTEVTGINISAPKPVIVTNTDQVLMLLPQTVTAWNLTPNASSSTDSYLKISCKIYSKATGETVNNVYLHGGADNYAELYVPFAGENMEKAMGKRITYGLQFGGGYTDGGEPILTPITFSSEVTEWTDQTPAPAVNVSN